MLNFMRNSGRDLRVSFIDVGGDALGGAGIENVYQKNSTRTTCQVGIGTFISYIII